VKRTDLVQLQPGDQHVVDGVTFHESERGHAGYTTEGTTGLPAGGEMDYVDYAGAGESALLSFERWAPNMPWEATKFPGIKIKLLYTDASGITTALFKLEPGAVVPLHEHTALEQTYVIEGSLEDHEGKCGPGQFVWRPAGNRHQAVAPTGAVLLGFFLKPNRFAYGEEFFTAAGER
jgi:quercetin dioxygenase-like cupin family protein